jgi:hypothetical protein
MMEFHLEIALCHPARGNLQCMEKQNIPFGTRGQMQKAGKDWEAQAEQGRCKEQWQSLVAQLARLLVMVRAPWKWQSELLVILTHFL